MKSAIEILFPIKYCP